MRMRVLFAIVALFSAQSALSEEAFDVDAHRSYVEVFDRKISYLEAGEGAPIVFLHGQSEGAHSWRKVIPHVLDRGRIIAIDNVGQGASDRLTEDYGPDRYRFLDHYTYIEQALETLGVDEEIVLIGTDWGASLAFHFAAQHPDKVSAIVFMEAMITPYSRDVDAEGPFARFLDFTRDTERLHKMYIEDYEAQMARYWKNEGAGEDAMEHFMRYYGGAPERREALLQWPQEVPIDGSPADNHAAFLAYKKWLRESPVPKLLIKVEPGAMVRERDFEEIKQFPNISVAYVEGYHVPFENAANEVGAAIADWLGTLQ